VLTCKTNEFTLTAELIDRSADAFIVEFKWLPENLSFAEILDKTGMMPIPPYLRRESEEIDLKRYQTVYALHEGSVAAPTAGLHFTEPLLEKLKANYVDIEYVTLHVGAGTFKPVKAARMEMHEMHAELIDVNKSTIQRLLQALQLGQPVIAVGTTSLRTIESLYWIGVKILQHPGLSGNNISVDQWAPYEHTAESTAVSVLDSLLAWMAKNNMERIVCKTQIMIAPPYNLKIASALVTNFHQPNSTLLLLVAAVTGNNWKEIYNYALLHQFRFLSYGDGSLLWGMKNTDGPV
jgi:S-adenosylmethionine:tRNA ribosyltransferase-isomerase